MARSYRNPGFIVISVSYLLVIAHVHVDLVKYLGPPPSRLMSPRESDPIEANEVKAISLKDKEQKSEWYLKINPNGRLPTLIDHAKEDFPIWESSAILLYIAQHFDTEHKISYDPVTEPKLYSEQLQWIFFAHGGIAPIVHFIRLAPEEIPYAIKRYKDESIRLIGVLEERLKGRDWLVGPHYSLADIKTLIRGTKLFDVDLNDYPNTQKWLERILARPKTDKGLGVPTRTDIEAMLKRTPEEYRAFGAALFGFKKVE
ncbi:hypothetical protein Clacol_005332 [Clathrus columnatus]|uniref:Glutathione S-transferase n=1 Tax=Clathrus columnatus TaxID=1419009 RepID=A0AAV5A8Z5_9AGAM|nr:hypothetical protein Clacol_005332 [Clathrus columnatus]